MSLPLIELDAREALPGDLFERIYQGRALGAVVRGVFEERELAGLVEGLADGTFCVPASRMTHYAGHQYGRNLVVTDDTDLYLTEAARLRDALARHPSDYEARLVRTLSRLAEGLTVEPPRAPDGRAFAPCTVRELFPGGSIDLHCELETHRFPTMAGLKPLLDERGELSFYVPLRLPEAGGELEVFHVRHGEASGAALSRMSRDGDQTLTYVRSFGCTVPRPGVGDLLIFDAGQHFHRVTRVEGERARWTIGGFLAKSREGRRVHYWS